LGRLEGVDVRLLFGTLRLHLSQRILHAVQLIVQLFQLTVLLDQVCLGLFYALFS